MVGKRAFIITWRQTVNPLGIWRKQGETLSNRVLRKGHLGPSLALGPPSKQMLQNNKEERWSCEGRCSYNCLNVPVRFGGVLSAL